VEVSLLLFASFAVLDLSFVESDNGISLSPCEETLDVTFPFCESSAAVFFSTFTSSDLGIMLFVNNSLVGFQSKLLDGSWLF